MADLAPLLQRARSLADALPDAQSDRLTRSVIRPLAAAVGDGDAPPEAVTAGNGAGGGDELWWLTRDLTTARCADGAPLEVIEATAALQQLALAADPDRLDELRALQSALPQSIQCQSDGPYLVTNAERLTDWLGESLPVAPQIALCRCGQSASKPFCDGTHAEVGFTDAKDSRRVPDRRDTYVGQQVTVFDNRGICQHAGFCTDRIATAFRTDAEPFVAPSGGRMDEIIRAVRDCPSGALSYAIDGVEARDAVDHHGTREAAIEVSRDGPYRVVGAIRLLDGAGEDEPRAEGASLEHYALCRCGQSQNKPFCSGMHWYVEFKDPVRDPDAEPTIFEWAGGYPALLRMTRLFYEKYVPQDPLLAPLFANMAADHPERVAKWLGEVFCGPKQYSEQYGGYSRMISQHLGKEITEEKRGRWVRLILQAAHDAGLPNDPELRAAFSSYVEWGSRLAVENSQAGAHPPEHMPMPHWDWNTAAGPPGSRVSAVGPEPEEDAPVVLPDVGETASFEKHVKTFFRAHDRKSMERAFDLWSYDDVKANSQAILERVRNGSMPCDGAWPSERVDAFDRWVSDGAQP